MLPPQQKVTKDLELVPTQVVEGKREISFQPGGPAQRGAQIQQGIRFGGNDEATHWVGLGALRSIGSKKERECKYTTPATTASAGRSYSGLSHLRPESHPSRFTRSGPNAGRQTAMYSAPSGAGVL